MEEFQLQVSVPKTKNRTTAYILAVFLGIFGGHRFYIGKKWTAITMLLITVLSFGFLIIITIPWTIVDLFLIRSWIPDDSTSKNNTSTISEPNTIEKSVSSSEEKSQIKINVTDFFHIKQLKKENEELKIKASEKLSLKQMKPAEIDELIQDKNNEFEKLIQNKNAEIDLLSKKLLAEQKNAQTALLDTKKQKDDLAIEINELENKKATLSNQVIELTDQVNVESFGLYEPRYDFSNSLSYKARLDEIRLSQKEMIKNELAIIIFRPMTLDRSASRGKSMQKKNGKQLIRTFNGESEAAINKVSYSNIGRIEKKIEKSFTDLNKLNDPNGISLSSKYLDSKLDELYVGFEYETKKQQEKEDLREQRQREKEEKALQKEIADKQKNIDKEIKHFSTMLDELKSEMKSKSEKEQLALQKQIDELQAKINENEKQKNELDYRIENSTAGYVYIISNIGSFGKNVLKIGVTRRLEPMERVDELGSASVPFKFDVHALIFSYDAYKLESELHDKFADKRINKMNSRKEYFNLSIDEIKDTLNQYKDLTIDFNEIPEASEYRESLKVVV